MAMGDDTLGMKNITDSRPRVVETDFSKFDRSQSAKMIDLLPQFFEKMGYHRAAALYRQIYTSKIKFNWRSAEQSVKIKTYGKEEMVLTGEPFTCLGNSLRNVLVSSIALCFDDDRVYAQAGFTAKIRLHSSVDGATFLKGVFLPAENTQDFAWIRLPSFLLKFGKTLTDLISMYPKTWSVQRRYQQALWSQWKGYGNMRTNYFYEAIHLNLKRLCPEASDTDCYFKEYSSLYSVKAEYLDVNSDVTVWIDDDTWNSFLLNRYKIHPEDVDIFLSTLQQVQVLPALLSQRLSTLLLVDYL